MLEKLVESVIFALKAADIPAAAAYVKAPVESEDGFVRVGVKSANDACSGFAKYLGIRQDAENGDKELYGLQCEIELSVDVYVPSCEENSGLICAAMFDSAAMVISGMEGLQVRRLSCGTPSPDDKTGMFHLGGSILCRAWLIAEGAEDTGAFTDFILKGDLKK